MVSPTVFYKLLVPLLRCEVADMRDSVVLALGTINHIAIMDLMSEVSFVIFSCIDDNNPERISLGFTRIYTPGYLCRNSQVKGGSN